MIVRRSFHETRGKVIRLVVLALAFFICAGACTGKDRRAASGAAAGIAGGTRSISLPPAKLSMEARSASGGIIGTLRKLDDFPLYELRYAEDYDLDDFLAPGTAEVPASTTPEYACTCFAASDVEGRRVMGRNFDWQRHPVMVLITAPSGGFASLSLVDLHYLGYSQGHDPEDDPSALYRSPALPFDGMNEKGLAVGMMAVDHAEGIAAREDGDPQRPRVGELGLIRLLLDRASSVGEAIELMGKYDVVFEGPALHYFVADASGASAVAEYSGGKLRIFRNAGGWQVSTNFLFGDIDPARWKASCPRYSLVSSRLEVSGGRLDKRGAFGLLADVSQPSTRWSSVYSLEKLSLELALGREYAKKFKWSM